MIIAVLDTNVVVQSLIGSPRCASARALDALFDQRYQIATSPAVLNEWLEVLSIPKIRKRHGLTDDEILDFLAALLISGSWHLGQAKLTAALTRDLSDTNSLHWLQNLVPITSSPTTINTCCRSNNFN